MFGVIAGSMLLLISAFLFWNATKVQSIMHISAGEIARFQSHSDAGCSETSPEKTLAFQHSLGFFDDINDKEWREIYQPRARSTVHYQSPGNPNLNSQNAAFWLFFNQEPAFNCPHLFKVGGLGDGPKWTCDPERLAKQVQRRKMADPGSKESKCLVYSIGSNGNYRFEDGLYSMLGKDCEVHIFDFGNFGKNPDLLKTKNMFYHQIGLKSSYDDQYQQVINNPDKEWLTFQEIRKKLGHEHRPLDIFKIDCEGCEWHTFKDWIKEDIRQILIETHELPFTHIQRQTEFGLFPQMGADEYFDAFEANNFVMFAKEINSPNWDGIGGRCSEWSYIKMAPEFLGERHSNPVSVRGVRNGKIVNLSIRRSSAINAKLNSVSLK